MMPQRNRDPRQLVAVALAHGLTVDQAANVAKVKPRVVRRWQADRRVTRLVDAIKAGQEGPSPGGVDLRARTLIRRQDPRIATTQELLDAGQAAESPDEAYFAAAKVVALVDAEEELLARQLRR
jgi:hypothetical protein